MATAMEMTLSCTICLDSYIDPCIPKNLDCGHVCCQICLQQLFQGSKKKGFVQCPECRRYAKVPSGRISNLSTNFPLKSLAEAEHKRKQSAPNRRSTIQRRVDSLREQANQAEDAASLQLKIQCLEQQLQEKAQPSNEVYTELEDGDFDSPMYMDLEECRQTSQPESQSARPLPSVPSDRPTPTIPDKPRLSLPSGSTLPIDGASILSSPTRMKNTSPSRHSLPQIPTKHNSSEVSIHLHRRQLEHVQAFGNFEQAQGIALAPNGSVAVCDFVKQIVSIFHKKKHIYEKKFDLKMNSKNSNKPADVAVTKNGKFLISRRTEVEMYSPKGKYERSLPNFIKETLGICTVAVADDGRILVGDISFFNIIIYDPEGRAILQTLRSETKPGRIAALHGTLFAVSHARLGRVEIFDSSMNQSIRLIETPEPLGMCAYPNSNFILLVRSEQLNPGLVQRHTGVIDQYDIETGTLNAVIAEGLFHPFNLTFIANGMLAVADKYTVKIFRLMDDLLYE